MLLLTGIPTPYFEDKFFDIFHIIVGCNYHMKGLFITSWVSCLDYSISIWTNNLILPGWMFVTRKPHPKGNYYHDMCCGESRIMYRWELVEGGYRTEDLGSPDFQRVPGTSTMALMWRMIKKLGTVKTMIMDSGFYVLIGLLIMFEIATCESALVKNRRYWPTGNYGEGINFHRLKKKLA